MPKKPFVDFREVRSRITMEQVLEHYDVLDTFKRTGTRLSGPCPIHGGSNPTQFRVDTNKNIWNCFSECKQGGNVLDFIAKKEDVSIHEAAIKACEWFNVPLQDVKTNRQPAPEAEDHSPAPPAKPKSTPATKPEDSTPNPPLKFKLEKLDRSHPYFAERGLSQETVIDFGLGYFTGDKGLMVGRIVIPIHNVNGEVVAYAGRWPGDPPEGAPKYKLPTGFKKGQEVFNLGRAIKETTERPMLIVEGFFDAIKMHQHGYRNVVALMGSTMSAEQEELIRGNTNANSRVVVMFDEDEAGKAGREEIAARLSRFCFAKIHAFERPDMQPEHLTPKDVQQLFQ
jgi:DNA primase